MSTAEIINSQPPFPEDIATCDLLVLSYGKLLANDSAESKNLFRACMKTGFFLLDLRWTTEGESFLGDAKGILQLDRELGALSHSEKSRYVSKPPEVTG